MRPRYWWRRLTTIQVVGVVGQFAAQAQVAQHDVDGDVGAHGDHVRVHQAAGGVLVVGQHLLEALAVLAVHRLEHFVDDGIAAGRRPGRRGRRCRGLRPRRRFRPGSMSASRPSRTSSPTCTSTSPSSSGSTRPQTTARLAGRQRLEQVADLGRRQGIDQPLYRAEAAAVERVGQQAQLARGLVVADGFGHGASRVWQERAGSHPRSARRHQVFIAALSRVGGVLHTPARDRHARLRPIRGCIAGERQRRHGHGADHLSRRVATPQSSQPELPPLMLANANRAHLRRAWTR